MHVFQMNDCDWMAAETAEEAKAEYIAHYFCDEYEECAPVKLTDEQMERLKFTDEDKAVRTFKQQLEKMIADGEKFPTFFASTEY